MPRSDAADDDDDDDDDDVLVLVLVLLLGSTYVRIRSFWYVFVYVRITSKWNEYDVFRLRFEVALKSAARSS